MNFYTTEHLFYCGVDLHTRSMYICVLDQGGQILLHRNLPAEPSTQTVKTDLSCPSPEPATN